MGIITTQLRTIVENNQIGDVLDTYPIFDENYRGVLNKKIIDHYYMREIGGETLGQFKWFLRTKMNEIMPYYNQLYLSELIEFSALTHVDNTETYSKEFERDFTNVKSDITDIETNSTSEQDLSETIENSTADVDKRSSNITSDNTNIRASEGKNVNSDTPNGSLTTENIDGEYYANNVNISKDSRSDTMKSTNVTTDDRTNTINVNGDRVRVNDVVSSEDSVSERNINETHSTSSTEDYLRNFKGNNPLRTDSQMIKEYRTTFLNIDMDIVNELEQLFVQIY